MSLRSAVRHLAFTSGALPLRHRLRHAETLTVAMFHRVVDPATAAAPAADPIYTLAAPLFAACLDFFRRHYSVVGLEALEAAMKGGTPLPPRALLLTFDDGWRDNLDVAAPLLRAAGLPALVFVATDVLDDPSPWWWQEVLLRALRTGQASFEALWSAPGTAPPPLAGSVPAELRLLLRYAVLDPGARHGLLAPIAAASGADAEGRHMLCPAGLCDLAATGIAIGAHGASHLPLSLMPEAGADLDRAMARLTAALPGCRIESLSFPHGRYDRTVLSQARMAGCRLLFTSDPCINAAPGGRPGRLLGRINIEAGEISGPDGRLDPSRLATWLFNRRVARLDAADDAGATTEIHAA